MGKNYSDLKELLGPPEYEVVLVPSRLSIYFAFIFFLLLSSTGWKYIFVPFPLHFDLVNFITCQIIFFLVLTYFFPWLSFKAGIIYISSEGIKYYRGYFKKSLVEIKWE